MFEDLFESKRETETRRAVKKGIQDAEGEREAGQAVVGIFTMMLSFMLLCLKWFFRILGYVLSYGGVLIHNLGIWIVDMTHLGDKTLLEEEEE